MPKRTIGTLIKTEFATANREEMDEAHRTKFGSAPAPDASDAEVRATLKSAYCAGIPVPPALQTHPHASEEVVASIATLPKIGKIPRLNATGPWDGRMRLVTLLPKDGSKVQETESVGWNGIQWTILCGVPTKMPWPYYQSLINTELLDDGSLAVSEWHPTKDKRLKKVVTPTYTKTINYIDHGDVPGTENLPQDYADYFRREAVRTGCFKAFQRPALVMVHNYLFEPMGMGFFRDMRDEDIRIKIASCLGPDIEAILQNELYAEAASA
jgi:hypothetical protein